MFGFGLMKLQVYSGRRYMGICPFDTLSSIPFSVQHPMPFSKAEIASVFLGRSNKAGVDPSTSSLACFVNSSTR